MSAQNFRNPGAEAVSESTGWAALRARVRLFLIVGLLVCLIVRAPERLALAETDPCPEPNNGFNNACFIGPATPSVQEVISSPDDVDAYRFEVKEPLVQARLTLNDLPADYELHLFNGVAAFLAEAGSQGTPSATIDITLTPNIYFLFVNSTHGQFDPGQPYRLTIATTPVDPAAYSLPAEVCRAVPAGGNTRCLLSSARPSTGLLEQAQDARTYRFEVGRSGSRVTTELSNTSPEVGLTLTTSEGVSIGRLTGSGYLASRLAQGSYYVQIVLNGDAPARSPYTLMVAVTPPETIPVAQDKDICPEPNDAPLSACAIAPDRTVNGYISNPGDMDCYAFDVDAKQTWVHVELSALPADYTLEIEDARETTLVSSHNGGLFPEVVDALLQPGRYYVLVHSIVGQGSEAQPYTLSLSMSAMGSGTRPRSTILLADNFNFMSGSFANTSNSASYELGVFDNEYVVKMHDASAGDENTSLEDFVTDSIPLDDFKLGLDVRVSVLPKNNGGVSLSWHCANQNRYVLYIDPVGGGARIVKVADGTFTGLTPWVSSPAIRRGNQSNHVTLISDGPHYRVLINDQAILDATDDSYRQGAVALGAVTWDQPTEVRYRNVLATALR